MSDRWISPPEYAAKYGLARHTVQVWAQQGKIRSVRKGKRFLVLDPNIFEIANPHSRLITKEDLMPLLRPCEVEELTGMPQRTLRDYARLGKVGFHHVGKHRRFSINDVREIMAIRRFNKTRVKPHEKRITIMEWAKSRLSQQNA
jgi:predicted site-specific integrase-resolvase